MVLLDGQYMCPLCDERFDTQFEQTCHIGEHNGQTAGFNGPANTHIAPATIYNPNAGVLASPFVPTPRKLQAPASAAPMNTHYTYSNVPYQPTPAYATSPTTHLLLTPPNSMGTLSPLPTAPTSIQTPTQTYPSPYWTAQPQQAQSSITSQQRGQRAFGNMLSRGQQAHLTPRSLPQQPLQRQFSGISKTQALSPPRSSVVCKTPSTAFRRAAVTLAGDLPPIPQAVYDLGLTYADFDPSQDNGKRCTASKYIDIPDSVGLAEEHMFNANDSTILGFGNLLRLAGRYTEPELVEKLNARRPETEKGTPFLGKALIAKRLKAAVKWAADRPEWQHVGNVEIWLDEKQKARLNYLYSPSSKRKREEDDDNAMPSIAASSQERYGVAPQAERSHFTTPPPSKRLRPAIPNTPPQVDAPYRSAVHGKLPETPSPPPANGDSAAETQQVAPTSVGLFNFSTPESMPSPAPPTEPSVSSMTNTQYMLEPTTRTVTLLEQAHRSADLVDLAGAIGMENAMFLANAVGMGDQYGAAAVEEAPEPAADAVEASSDENFDDLFQEFLSHPDHFMTPIDLKPGEKFSALMQRSAAKKSGIDNQNVTPETMKI